MALGAPRQVAVYDPARGGTANSGAGAWRTFAAGVYPHSVALGSADGEAWFNGHFTRAPELIGRVALGAGSAANGGAGRVDSVALPPHPALATDPGGPISYEIRVETIRQHPAAAPAALPTRRPHVPQSGQRSAPGSSLHQAAHAPNTF